MPSVIGCARDTVDSSTGWPCAARKEIQLLALPPVPRRRPGPVSVSGSPAARLICMTTSTAFAASVHLIGTRRSSREEDDRIGGAADVVRVRPKASPVVPVVECAPDCEYCRCPETD